MSDLVPRFMDWSLHDRNRSVNTIIRYREVLGSLGEVTDPATATLEDIEAWWASRIIKDDGEPRSAASRANELACLRAFYKWMQRFDHRPDNPTRRLDPPHVPIRVPKPIGKADMEALIADAPADLRRAFALGAYGGMRVAEAANADWSWVNDEARRIYILGKGNKERVFGLSATLNDLILPRTVGNIVTAGGPPYTPAQLQRRINRYMKTRTTGHTYHDLRKRGAAVAIEKTGDPIAVTKAYGWSDVNTAMHYHETSDDMLARIAEALT
jgi:site-specific recombinase XerC